jgi:hypothetical protein
MPGLKPEQEFFWGDHVVLILKESEMAAKRIRTQQAAIQGSINDFVPCG